MLFRLIALAGLLAAIGLTPAGAADRKPPTGDLPEPVLAKLSADGELHYLPKRIQAALAFTPATPQPYTTANLTDGIALPGGRYRLKAVPAASRHNVFLTDTDKGNDGVAVVDDPHFDRITAGVQKERLSHFPDRVVNLQFGPLTVHAEADGDGGHHGYIKTLTCFCKDEVLFVSGLNTRTPTAVRLKAGGHALKEALGADHLQGTALYWNDGAKEVLDAGGKRPAVDGGVIVPHDPARKLFDGTGYAHLDAGGEHGGADDKDIRAVYQSSHKLVEVKAALLAPDLPAKVREKLAAEQKAEEDFLKECLGYVEIQAKRGVAVERVFISTAGGRPTPDARPLKAAVRLKKGFGHPDNK